MRNFNLELMEQTTYQELLTYHQTQDIPKDALREAYKIWAQQFEENDNRLYIKGKRVIPRSEVTWIISMFHDDPTMAHQSKEAVFELIRERYTWKGMYRDIKEYIRTCWECQKRGTPRKNNRTRTIQPADIFERWGIDIIGPLQTTRNGNRYIIVTVDYFTRWPEARAVEKANVETVAMFIYEKIICQHGTPKVIQSD